MVGTRVGTALPALLDVPKKWKKVASDLEILIKLILWVYKNQNYNHSNLRGVSSN